MGRETANANATMKWRDFFFFFNGNGMKWNGMEWNGMEWNGMEWNGMVFFFCFRLCDSRGCAFAQDLEGIHDDAPAPFLIRGAARVHTGIGDTNIVRLKVHIHQGKGGLAFVLVTGNLDLGSLGVAPAFGDEHGIAGRIHKIPVEDTLGVFDVNVSWVLQEIVDSELDRQSFNVIVWFEVEV